MNLTEELKNCPFCGDKAECTISASNDGAINMTIRCAGCGAQITTEVPGPMDIEKATDVVESLVNKWNKRLEMIKNYYNEQLKITYMQSCDAVVTWVNGESTSFSLDRTRLKEAIAEYDKQHAEACKGAWIPFTDGFRCSKCQYESRYMFTKCLGCGAEMKNGTVD